MNSGGASGALADEIAALAEDLRQVLFDASLRGVDGEGRDAAVTPDPLPSVHRSVEGARAQSAWTEIADEARTLSDVPEIRGSAALQQIRGDLGDCRRCGLCEGRNQIVFGVGDPEADLMVIGEGPGQEEDLSGEPFVGPAGQMLDRMLSNVLGLQRSQVYIANIVKCRPPGNRNPEPDEIAACKPFLERQIAAIQPRLILVLGSVAFKALFEVEVGIKASRGRWREWRGIPVMPTFHPAYLLRSPDEKKWTFEDLKVVRGRYDELGGRR